LISLQCSPWASLVWVSDAAGVPGASSGDVLGSEAVGGESQITQQISGMRISVPIYMCPVETAEEKKPKFVGHTYM